MIFAARSSTNTGSRIRAGSFAFTGAATRQVEALQAAPQQQRDPIFADFLLGIPDTSAISFGNPDKYFRQSVYDLYFTDDWRMLPQFTVNAGMRWDYGAPMTELFRQAGESRCFAGIHLGRAGAGSNPKGSVTGMTYPSSLVRPDKHGFEPRIGISWRPIPASTLVVRSWLRNLRRHVGLSVGRGKHGGAGALCDQR